MVSTRLIQRSAAGLRWWARSGILRARGLGDLRHRDAYGNAYRGGQGGTKAA